MPNKTIIIIIIIIIITLLFVHKSLSPGNNTVFGKVTHNYVMTDNSSAFPSSDSHNTYA